MLSELNNLETYTLLNDITYNQYFGFTEEEVVQLLKDMELTDHKKVVSEWYNGYQTKDGLTIKCQETPYTKILVSGNFKKNRLYELISLKEQLALNRY
jgi:hypothetical protein